MTNYTMLGEYIAFSEQAKDAANRRFAEMHNLGQELMRLAGEPERNFDETEMQRRLKAISAADAEMKAALQKANEAAPLCGKPAIHPSSLAR